MLKNLYFQRRKTCEKLQVQVSDITVKHWNSASHSFYDYNKGICSTEFYLSILHLYDVAFAEINRLNNKFFQSSVMQHLCRHILYICTSFSKNASSCANIITLPFSMFLKTSLKNQTRKRNIFRAFRNFCTVDPEITRATVSNAVTVS